MASTYALPALSGEAAGYHSRGPSYSSTNQQASPKRSTFRGAANGNTFSHHVRQAGSNGSLYTHAEASHEGTPAHSPYDEAEQHQIANDYNNFAVNVNAALHSHSRDHSHTHTPIHSHNHTRASSPMKARPRGESDLGRPAAAVSTSTYRPSLESIPAAASSSWFSLPEALTSLLIPLPYLLASAAYLQPTDDVPLSDYANLQLSAFARLQKAAQDADHTHSFARSGCGLVEACSLTSGTLLLVGMIAKMRSSERTLDRRKDKLVASRHAESMFTLAAARRIAGRSLAVALPIYAATQVGGMRVGLLMLVSAAAGTTTGDTTPRPSLHDWRHIIKTRRATIAVVLLSTILDMFEVTIRAPTVDLLTGYLALSSAILFFPLPLPTSNATQTNSDATQTATTSRASWSRPVISPLVSSAVEVNITIAAGVTMFALTLGVSIILRIAPPVDPMAIIFGILSFTTSASAILFSTPSTLLSQHKAGLGLGCLLVASSAFLFSPSLWPGTVCNGGLAVLSYFGVRHDTQTPKAHRHDDHDDVHDHAHNTHTTHHHTDGKHSFFTAFFLNNCEPGSLAYGILSDKDSRRIAYFTCLNFAFMLVQGVYGYLSGSLGLLSDTVHMFFDCLGLVIGLGAAVASKWPTSPEKPYGWGKLNTLAGFGNGIFLMLVSVEFVWEALEGIMERKEIRRVEELLVVSTLGFVVNMIGLVAFGHAHHGHDHGHSHGGHDHGHGHGHNHANDHSHDHLHDHHHDHHSHDHSSHTHSHTRNHSTASHISHISRTSNGSVDTFPTHVHTPTVSKFDLSMPQPTANHTHHDHSHHDHSHHEHNENMHGIFLHVAADAGGSLAVIISTALTLWKPWYLWDPLATILIAILIFAAAVPLVSASGRKLLLVIPDELEWGIKTTLQELGEIRGVAGYGGVRFWVDDRDPDAVEEVGDEKVVMKKKSTAGAGPKVMGVIHIYASPVADLEDVRCRVEEFVGEKGMDVVLHVEKQAEEEGCWCGD